MTIGIVKNDCPANLDLAKTPTETTEDIITVNQIQSSAVYHVPAQLEDQHIEAVIDTAAESTVRPDFQQIMSETKNTL